jgi:ribosomal protein L11 methyltransferase
VEESDWAESWKEHFHVLHLGKRLVVKPSWRKHHRTGDEVVIDLDPGMAFGTGLHPTTRLCLRALEERSERGPLGRALDVGCGSGILAIAAVKLGATRVLGVDIDPIAIEATEANARHNRVNKRIRAREGSVPTDDGPFDLVLANLIAGILVELAPHLADEVAEGGTLIASGIFIDREADVRAALESAGLRIVKAWHESDWVALEAAR